MACNQFSNIATFFKPNCSVMYSLRLSNFKDWNKRLRISVCTKPIVADIEKIRNCLVFIIENKPPLF